MPRLRHLLIQGTAQPQPYVYAKTVGSSPFNTPPRDAPADPRRTAGGRSAASSGRPRHSTRSQLPEGIEFVPITLRSDPGFKLMLDSLDNKTVATGQCPIGAGWQPESHYPPAQRQGARFRQKIRSICT